MIIVTDGYIVTNTHMHMHRFTQHTCLYALYMHTTYTACVYMRVFFHFLYGNDLKSTEIKLNEGNEENCYLIFSDNHFDGR